MKNNVINQGSAAKKPFQKKSSLAAGMVLLLIIVSLVFIWFNQEPKADPASETLIRQLAAGQLYYETKIKKYPNDLTDEDFAKITALTLETKTLSDIRLLKKFRNLQILHLENIRCQSKAMPNWKRFMSKIPFIHFPQENYIDLGFLKELLSLQLLNLMGTQVCNLKPIKGLTKLQSLIITRGQISNLEPLRDLTNLKTLFISSGVSDLETLQDL
ncbi:MAG: hypothetical protein P8016_13400 [Sedimentisphaerales bacterium]